MYPCFLFFSFWYVVSPVAIVHHIVIFVVHTCVYMLRRGMYISANRTNLEAFRFNIFVLLGNIVTEWLLAALASRISARPRKSAILKFLSHVF